MPLGFKIFLFPDNGDKDIIIICYLRIIRMLTRISKKMLAY